MRLLKRVPLNFLCEIDTQVYIIPRHDTRTYSLSAEETFL